MLALAAGGTDLQGQGHRQHPADPHRRFHCRDHADRPRRGSLGRIADRVRHLGRRCAAQRAQRLHQCETQRQDRDGPARGRGTGQCPHRLRRRRCDAGHGFRSRDPLPHYRRACVQGPEIHRRARHPAHRRRPGRLDVGDPAFRSQPGGTRRLSQDAPCGGRSRGRCGERRRGHHPAGRTEPGTLCGNVGGRKPDPHHHVGRSGQAVVVP